MLSNLGLSQICRVIQQNKSYLRLIPEMVAWVVQCLILAQFDSDQSQQLDNQIEECKNSLLRIVCLYRTHQSSEQNQLSIQKLVLNSVITKYSAEKVSKVKNKVYLLICLELTKNYKQILKQFPLESILQLKEQKKIHCICNKFISICYTFFVEYFSIESDKQEQTQFGEEQMQQSQQQSQLALKIILEIYQVLSYLSNPTAKADLLSPACTARHQYIMSILFTQKKQVSVICLSIVAIQTLFQCFEDFNVQPRKVILKLLTDFTFLMISLSENSGEIQTIAFEEQLRSVFTNTLGFLENKFYQYFYYPYQRHQNLNFAVENKIRKNIQDMKKSIISVFEGLIGIIKFIYDTSSLEHKSFYELMKPKRKSASKSALKNFYPMCWKQADEKIIQYLCLTSTALKEARQKLQAHLLQKRLSFYSSSMEKAITKKIQLFIKLQNKRNEGKLKNSVHYYMKNQTDKCKEYIDWEQQLSVIRFEASHRIKTDDLRKKEINEKIKRQIGYSLEKILNSHRVYEGLWSNHHFYSFSQIDEDKQKNIELGNFYQRIRSHRLSKYHLMPLMKIVVKQRLKTIERLSQKQSDDYYLNESFLEGQQKKKQSKQQNISMPRSQKYFKIGLRFLKKKVIEKIMRNTSSSNLSVAPKNIQSPISTFFTNILWIKPMQVCLGHIKITSNTLSYCFKSSTQIQHLSLTKPKKKTKQLLIVNWDLKKIKYFLIRKFMLKTNSVQIFFSNSPPVFLSFYDKCQKQLEFKTFVQLLQKYKNSHNQQLNHIPRLFSHYDIIKSVEKSMVTEAWRKGLMSNFNYLMMLNIMAGRSTCDLNQYFIFPWIFSNYQSLKPKDHLKYRDLSKSLGALGPIERTHKFEQVFRNLQENLKSQFPQSHHFGFHYSNLAIVLQYLIRIQPYTEGAICLQGGKFDLPDRLFSSLGDSFRNATNQMSDLRELIPQFFYFPQFLTNQEDLQFGYQQSKKKVNHVQLPLQYSNSYDFIEGHRQALESDEVSSNIHKWIDLIFGYKQLGKEAQLSLNKFHYLTYEHNSYLVPTLEQQSWQESKTQKEKRESIESQIAYYGKTPTQLFTKPHPQKQIIAQTQKITYKCSRAVPFQFESKPIHLSVNSLSGRYTFLRKDGKGIVFTLVKKECLTINVMKQFEINLSKYQNMHIIDERLYPSDSDPNIALYPNIKNIPVAAISSQQIIIGGIWGGKLLKYSILTDKYQMYKKHSETVTALCSSEQLSLIISGSLNGQIIIWEFSQTHKLLYRQKHAYHTKAIICISIDTDLNIGLMGSNDNLLSIVDLENYQLMRILMLPSPILQSYLISNPYYMLYIHCQNAKVYCYSLNGKFIDSSQMENIQMSQVINEDWRGRFQQKIIMKKDKQFVWIKVPDFIIENRYELKEEDSNITHFIHYKGNILFTTKNELVYLESSHSTQIVDVVDNSPQNTVVSIFQQ